ncbi:hypothetical protein EYF80_011779 [Liparis tanakae]|uniref:Secreted protein n=1 Tax=Liparis tanakae TaxID=230148 RepID=A0A4Z2IJP9_9TELE|nr:hypothetical protein EYF80_011779 [Liparis tanakae]
MGTLGALPAWKAVLFFSNLISAAVAKRHVVYWNSTNARGSFVGSAGLILESARVVSSVSKRRVVKVSDWKHSAFRPAVCVCGNTRRPLCRPLV